MVKIRQMSPLHKVTQTGVNRHIHYTLTYTLALMYAKYRVKSLVVFEIFGKTQSGLVFWTHPVYHSLGVFVR